MASIELYQDDLPEGFDPGTSVAVDTEAMGLRMVRDRLCLVQLSAGDGNAVLVQVRKERLHSPNLVRLLARTDVTKIFHFARFDVKLLHNTFGVTISPIYCTKIASKIARTYSNQHGLRQLAAELLGVELVKEQQSSDWGAESLTRDQLSYAANDVLYLHAIRKALNTILVREDRMDLAQACFDFLPWRAKLDARGWPEDVFSH